MDYKKKYKEALERAKKLYEQGTITESLSYIFPELKESEDERIRKRIYNYINVTLDDNESAEKEKWLAWLEKQGEQKSIDNLTQQEAMDIAVAKCFDEQNLTDKVEPKFKVGDWVNGYYTNYKVLSVNNDGYLVEDVDENKINILFENEKFHHLWTVQDAKDGDVLVAGEVIFIFNKIHGVWINCHCSLHKDGSFNDEDYDLSNIKYSKEIHPATKEQRELLFQKMKEAGYEWDKKELKTILITPRFEIGDVLCDKSCTTLDKKSQPNFEIIDIRNDMYICDKCSFPIYQQDEYELVAKKIKQCSTWSEEDERICQCLIESQKESLNMVNNNKYSHSEIISDLKEMYSERINWLKSLKDRVGCKANCTTMWKPSESRFGEAKEAEEADKSKT